VPVGYSSLEESALQVSRKILATRSGVSVDRQRRGEVNMIEWPRLQDATAALSRLPLYIDDTPAMDLSRISARARRWRERDGIQLLVVDHMHLMRSLSRRASENRVQELSEYSAGLKVLAKELDIPVLALCQLSRAVEQRDNKRPQLSDLRESGSLEQDADVAMFVYREEYYLARAEPTKRDNERDDAFNDRYERWKERCEQTYGLAEIIIGKNRSGPVGIVRVQFDGEMMQFGNYIGPEYLPEQL
jgi:replicative DNA helicase